MSAVESFFLRKMKGRGSDVMRASHMWFLLQVMSALHMIMQKWKSEAVFDDQPEVDPEHVQLRVAMLGKLCGAIIGESGKTINDIKMATSTEVRIQVCKSVFRYASFWAVRGRNQAMPSICG